MINSPSAISTLCHYGKFALPIAAVALNCKMTYDICANFGKQTQFSSHSPIRMKVIILVSGTLASSLFAYLTNGILGLVTLIALNTLAIAISFIKSAENRVLEPDVRFCIKLQHLFIQNQLELSRLDRDVELYLENNPVNFLVKIMIIISLSKLNENRCIFSKDRKTLETKKILFDNLPSNIKKCFDADDFYKFYNRYIDCREEVSDDGNIVNRISLKEKELALKSMKFIYKACQ